jgi:hypothetical protein
MRITPYILLLCFTRRKFGYYSETEPLANRAAQSRRSDFDSFDSEPDRHCLLSSVVAELGLL